MRALHLMGSTFRCPGRVSSQCLGHRTTHLVCDLRQVALASSAASGSGTAVPVEDAEEPSVQHLAPMLDHALLGVRCSTAGHSGWGYPAALC